MFSYFDLIYDEPAFDSVGYFTPDKNGHVYSRLKGRVRSASSFHYKIEKGNKKCSNKCYYAVFDEHGQLRHEEESDMVGNLKQIISYIYDVNNRCVELFIFDSKGVVSTHYVNRYNEMNLLSEEESFDESGSRGKRVYIYDNQGFVIEDRWDSRTHGNSWKCLYKNNEHGDWVEMKEYKGEYDSSDYWYSRKNIKKYDDNNRLIEHIYVNNDGKENNLSIDEYDEKGRCIKMSDFKLIFFYDGRDRFIEARNPEGQLVIRVLYNEDNSIIILRYSQESLQIEKKRDVKFDSHGNVIKILYYEGENLELVEVASYCYEYYPE